mgnify:CR=1 FL=1
MKEKGYPELSLSCFLQRETAAENMRKSESSRKKKKTTKSGGTCGLVKWRGHVGFELGLTFLPKGKMYGRKLANNNSIPKRTLVNHSLFAKEVLSFFSIPK